MFNCDYCTKAVGPRVPLNLIPVQGEERHVSYKVVTRDSETGLVQGFTMVAGTEITHEYKVCPACLGLKDKPPADVARPLGYIALVHGLQEHGKRCKKPYVECGTCLLAERAYGSVPIVPMTAALEQPLARKARFSLGIVVVENLLRRGEHNTKRGLRDFSAAYSVLKAYEQRGGGI